MTTASRFRFMIKRDLWLSLSVTITGLLLVPLLFIGTYVGTGTVIFSLLAGVHGIFLIASLAIGVLDLIHKKEDFSALEWALLLFTISILGIELLETSLPVFYKDALIHHLAVARWWSMRGEIYSPDWHEWSHYPMLINLGYLALEGWGLGKLSSQYHWLLSILTSLVIAEGTSQLLKSKRAGMMAFALSSTIPLISRISAVPLVDMGLALFASNSFFLILKAGDDSLSKERRFFLLSLCALSLGLALSTKYNALVFTVSMACLYPLLRAHAPVRTVINEMLLLGVLSLLVFAPWLFRNYHLTGNPVYPLYGGLFAQKIERPSGMPSLKPLQQRTLIYGESPLEMAFLPIRIFFEGADEIPAKFDGVLSPILLVGIAIGLLCFSEKNIRFSFLLCLLYFLIALFSNPLRVRYLVPLLGPISLLSSQGLCVLLSKRSFPKITGILLLIVHSLFMSSYLYKKTAREDLVPFLKGEITEKQYLEERIPEYELISYLNKELSEESKIYLLFTGNRFSLFKPLVFSGGHFSASYLLDWIKRSTKTGEPLYKRFSDKKITHLFAESGRAQRFALEQLSPEERSTWEKFISTHLTFLHEAKGYSLWMIHD